MVIHLGGLDGPAGRRGMPRWWPLLPLALAVLMVVILIQGATRPLAGAPVAASPLTPLASVEVRATGSPSSGPISDAAPTDGIRAVRQLGHPLLPEMTGTWQLLARGDEWLSRIDPRTGRIDSTTIPGLASGGPVSFLSGPDETLVRPLDFVDGYLMPDRYPTQKAAVPLDHGPVFPGPDTEHIWAAQGSAAGDDAYMLLDWRGQKAGPVIAVPSGLSAQAALADGAGGLLFVLKDSTVLSVGPRHSQRLGKGAVLATGPTGVLILECASARCAAVVATVKGVRRTLPVTGAPLSPSALYQTGVLSPDGRTAAFVATPVVQKGRAVTIGLMLVDLRSGRITTMAGRIPGATAYPGQLAWSPDSRWLFAVVDQGEIVAVDHMGVVWGLNLDLPPQRQLVIRPAGR